MSCVCEPQLRQRRGQIVNTRCGVSVGANGCTATTPRYDVSLGCSPEGVTWLHLRPPEPICWTFRFCWTVDSAGLQILPDRRFCRTADFAGQQACRRAERQKGRRAGGQESQWGAGFRDHSCRHTAMVRKRSETNMAINEQQHVLIYIYVGNPSIPDMAVSLSLSFLSFVSSKLDF